MSDAGPESGKGKKKAKTTYVVDSESEREAEAEQGQSQGQGQAQSQGPEVKLSELKELTEAVKSLVKVQKESLNQMKYNLIAINNLALGVVEVADSVIRVWSTMLRLAGVEDTIAEVSDEDYMLEGSEEEEEEGAPDERLEEIARGAEGVTDVDME